MFKYRAQKKTGEWIEGFYVNIAVHEIIYPLPCGNGFDKAEIIPETLGVSYGFRDWNNQEVFASYRKNDISTNPLTTGGSVVATAYGFEAKILFFDGVFSVDGRPLDMYEPHELTVVGYQAGEKL